jgi:hypothetical protein
VSDHDQFRELIEAYALGALDEQDRAALEAHLATGCAECAKALEEARWLTSQLAYLAPPAQPSDMLKARLLQKVRAEANTAKTTASSRTNVPYWLWAGVAALLLVTLYSTWDARRLQKEIQAVNERAAAELKQRQQLQQQLDAAKHEAHILMDPTSKKFPMWPHDTQMPRLEATWHPEMGIFVTGEKIPMPSSHTIEAHTESEGWQAYAFAHVLAGCRRESSRYGGQSTRGDGGNESSSHYGRTRWRKFATHQHADVGRRSQLEPFVLGQQ